MLMVFLYTVLNHLEPLIFKEEQFFKNIIFHETVENKLFTISIVFGPQVDLVDSSTVLVFNNWVQKEIVNGFINPLFVEELQIIELFLEKVNDFFFFA